MKKVFFVFLIFSILVMTALTQSASSRELTLSKIEGVVTSFSSGSDAFVITLSDSAGKTKTFKVTPGALEEFTPEEKKELEGMKAEMPEKKWPGNYFPTIMDLYSSVRILYIESPECYLSYEVIKRPPALWITVVSSAKDSIKAYSLKNKLKEQGFETCEIVLSTHYKILKSGYFVVVSGACRSEAEAQKNCALSRQKGWKDAYNKKVW